MANWAKRFWDEIRPHFLWWIIYSIIAGGMLTAVIAWIRALANSPIDGATAAIIFSVCFIGLVILFFTTRRNRVKSIGSEGVLTRMIIVYLPLLAGLVLCIWAYFVGTKVFGVSKDVKHLQAQMVRYVMPRQLTPEQIDSIGDYLSKQDRNQVVMQIINRDQEASSYRADIQRALEKGGWAVSDFKYADDIQEGLSISMQSPMLPPQPVNAFERLNPKPTPVQILSEAFKRAGVQVQSTGGGSGINITTTTITISIGSRRRDQGAVLPPNYGSGIRPHTPAITDDDF